MRFQSLVATAAGVGLLCPRASAHMSMSDPPPLKGKNNPNSKNPDSSMTSPLSTGGSDYPCKGYHKLHNTSEGKPVATWAAGSAQHFSIEGGAAHGGGSCQAALSYDGGNTFKVIKSYVGGCPTASGGTFDFTVPAQASASDNAIFAWTWFNQIGNREMYMNCAVVGITGGSGGDLSALPDLFVANIGNGCTTTESTDVVFPDPGADVVTASQKSSPPKGTCRQAKSKSGSVLGGGNNSTNGSAPAGNAAPSGGASGSGSAKPSYTLPSQKPGFIGVPDGSYSSPSSNGTHTKPSQGVRTFKTMTKPRSGFIGVPVGSQTYAQSSASSSTTPSSEIVEVSDHVTVKTEMKTVTAPPIPPSSTAKGKGEKSA